jgi:hypothetical protein
LTGIIAPLTAFAQGEEEKGIPAKSIATILPEHGDPDGSRKDWLPAASPMNGTTLASGKPTSPAG